jgi:hypothetical protein
VESDTVVDRFPDRIKRAVTRAHSALSKGGIIMTELTRRHLLGGLAGAGTLALTPSAPSDAAAPLTEKQNPGVYRSKLGDFEVTVVSDGARPIPLPPIQWW